MMIAVLTWYSYSVTLQWAFGVKKTWTFSSRLSMIPVISSEFFCSLFPVSLKTLPNYYQSMKCLQNQELNGLFQFRGLHAIHNWNRLSLGSTPLYTAPTSSITCSLTGERSYRLSSIIIHTHIELNPKNQSLFLIVFLIVIGSISIFQHLIVLRYNSIHHFHSLL